MARQSDRTMECLLRDAARIARGLNAARDVPADAREALRNLYAHLATMCGVEAPPLSPAPVASYDGPPEAPRAPVAPAPPAPPVAAPRGPSCRSCGGGHATEACPVFSPRPGTRAAKDATVPVASRPAANGKGPSGPGPAGVKGNGAAPVTARKDGRKASAGAGLPGWACVRWDKQHPDSTLTGWKVTGRMSPLPLCLRPADAAAIAALPVERVGWKGPGVEIVAYPGGLEGIERASPGVLARLARGAGAREAEATVRAIQGREAEEKKEREARGGAIDPRIGV